jgi:hypothetical protein
MAAAGCAEQSALNLSPQTHLQLPPQTLLPLPLQTLRPLPPQRARRCRHSRELTCGQRCLRLQDRRQTPQLQQQQERLPLALPLALRPQRGS